MSTKVGNVVYVLYQFFWNVDILKTVQAIKNMCPFKLNLENAFPVLIWILRDEKL